MPDGEPQRTTYFDLSRPRSSKPVRELPRLIGGALGFVWSTSRRATTGMFAASVLQSLLTVGQLAIAARLLSEIQRIGTDGDVADLAPELVAFAGLFVLQGVVGSAANELRFTLGERTAYRAQRLVSSAAARAPLIDFERPGFHDRLQRALANSASRPLQVANSVAAIATATIAAVALIITLAILQPLVLAVVVVAAAPIWLITRRLTRIGYEFMLTETEDDRRRGYLLHLLTAKPAAHELRAFQLAEFLSERHRRLWDARITRVDRLARRRFRLTSVSRLLNGALMAGVFLLLVWTVTSGRADLSRAAAAAGAVLLLGQRLNALVGGVGLLYECALFLSDVTAFTSAYGVEKPSDSTHRPNTSIETGTLDARGLCFQYPSGEREAVSGVDLAVRSGEMIALVGANGSGKTTVAKLLAGLLPTSAGTITWNDQVVTAGDAMWHANVAVVFQDYARYLLSLGENVGFGRTERLGDEEATTEAVAMAGLDRLLESLPHGTDTLLGPEFFGGTDISGGQWQRVALARAFFRDAGIVILDEPSSALDPDAEAALFETVKQLCAGRAVVVISHRFSTVTQADRIYVMRDGEVIESGSHRELMTEGGEYARMFSLQASRYSSPD